MIQEIKRFRKRWQRRQFLKNTVVAYSSPWAKIGKTLTDVNYNEGLHRDSVERFHQDCRGLVFSVVKKQPVQALPDLSKQVIESLLFAYDDLPVSEDKFYSVVEEYLDLCPPRSVAQKELLAPIDYIHMVLSQVLESDLLVYGYQYDFIDDIVPILKSRYITLNGTSDNHKAQRFIRTLWLLSGGNTSSDIETIEAGLSEALKTALGKAHIYTPTAKFTEPTDSFYQAHQKEYQELIELKGDDDTKKVVDIWEGVFEDLNQKMSKNPEDRNISLVHGYENNYHITLRTIIALKQKGLLKASDPVLILGPRFVDEILFLREYVGLKNTIGLDLRDEAGLIFKGDMHDMPFNDNSFKLVYGANVFEYAHNIRKVASEIIRVLDKPGYAMGILRSVRNTPNMPPVGTDISTPEAAVNMFYSTPHKVLAMDPGYAATSEFNDRFPSFALRLDADS